MKPMLGQMTLRFARTDSMAAETESPSTLIRYAHTICLAAAHGLGAFLSVKAGLQVVPQPQLLHEASGRAGDTLRLHAHHACARHLHSRSTGIRAARMCSGLWLGRRALLCRKQTEALP